MAGEALKYFVTMLIPTVDEFLNEQQNERRALLAFLVVNGMAEHYFQEESSSGNISVTKKCFLHKLRNENAHLHIARQIANATKHAEQIQGHARSTKGVKVADPKSGWKSPYMGYNVSGAYSGGTVHVETVPGQSVEAITLLKQSTLFWATKVRYDEAFMESLDRFRV